VWSQHLAPSDWVRYDSSRSRSLRPGGQSCAPRSSCESFASTALKVEEWPHSHRHTRWESPWLDPLVVVLERISERNFALKGHCFHKDLYWSWVCFSISHHDLGILRCVPQGCQYIFCLPWEGSWKVSAVVNVESLKFGPSSARVIVLVGSSLRYSWELEKLISILFGRCLDLDFQIAINYWPCSFWQSSSADVYRPSDRHPHYTDNLDWIGISKHSVSVAHYPAAFKF
jgi:hypothetical protein